MTLHHLSVSAEPYPVPAVRCGLQVIGKPRTTGLRPWLCPVEYDPRLTCAVSVERLLHRVAGSPEHLPREIGARAVFKVSIEEIISRGEPREIAARGVHTALTEKIISQGESPRLRTGRSVVRPGGSRQVVRGKYRDVICF